MSESLFARAIAQLETNDGKKSIKGPNGEDSNNLFNIKDFSKEGTGFRARDKAEGSNDRYRTYGSRQESLDDFFSLLDRKYPQAIVAAQAGDAQGFAQALKDGGYATDPNYVTKVTNTIASLQRKSQEAQSSRAVQDSVLRGQAPVAQLDALRKQGWGNDIDVATAKGYTAKEIVERIAGADVEVAKQAKARQDNTGALTRFGQAAGNTVSDAGLAVQQMLGGGDREVLQAEAARRADDIDRRALGATTAGALGSAAPSVALNLGAAALTGGTSIPLQAAVQGGVSAATGALRPTTEDGERTSNVLTDGALGAVGGAGGAVLAKGVGAGLKAIGPSAESQAGINAAEAAGLTPRGSDASPLLSGVAQSLKNQGNVAASDAARLATVEGNAANTLLDARQIAVRDLLKNAGQQGDSITSETVAGAGNRIYKPFNDALQGRVVPGAVGDDLANAQRTAQSALDDYKRLSSQHDLNPELLDTASRPGRPSEVLNRIATSTNGDELLAGRASLQNIIRSETATQADKVYAKSVLSILDAHIAKQAPDIAGSLAKANEQYANLVPLKKLVAATGDTGEFSVKQLARAIASNGKGSFAEGSAPQQKVLAALRDAEIKAAADRVGGQQVLNGARGLKASVGKGIGRVFGDGQGLEIGAGALQPSAIPALATRALVRKLLAVAATSENKTLIKVLSGNTGAQKALSNPAVREYVARALGGAGGASSS